MELFNGVTSNMSQHSMSLPLKGLEFQSGSDRFGKKELLFQPTE